MDPVTALIFAVLAAHVIMKAAAQAGADQARAEARRAGQAIRQDLQGRRTAAAGRLAGRLDAGRAAGPAYPAWWAWAAVRAAGAVRRGARQRRRAAEAGRRPLSRPTGPLGRILGAAWRGGLHALADARRQRRESPPPYQGPPAPGSGPGPRPRRARPQPVEVGVCERCGTVVAVSVLDEALTRHGRSARMCPYCRAEVGGQRQADAAEAAPASAEAGDVVDAEIVSDPGLAGGPAPGPDAADPEIVTGPAPAGAGAGPPSAGCVRCGEPLGASCCLNRDCPLCPEYRGGMAESREWPGHFRMPVRFCPGCGHQLLPSTWYAVNATNADVCLFCALGSNGRPGSHPDGACRERQPAELAAAGTPVDAAGRQLDIAPEAWQLLGAEAARIALENAPPYDSPPVPPAGERAPAALAAVPALPPPDPTGDTAMSCNGEIHTQADWGTQTSAIQDQVTAITDSAENMLAGLNARQAGREHMNLAAEWADKIRSCVTFGDAVIDAVNTRQDPYVSAVQGAGGSAEVAEPGYYDDM